MFRNPWISSYLQNVRHSAEEDFNKENSVRYKTPRLLQRRRTLSFQKEFSFEDKEELVNTTKDIDASLLAVLPKVSELRKLFEPNRQDTLEMKRKERIARRLEGIESDAQPVLSQNCPGLVTHRLLEEDTPRYMRATDPYSPHFGRSNEEEASQSSVDNQSRSRYQAESTGGRTKPPSYGPLAMDAQALESKAERIARYKAERRRQLAEKYGLSIDSDVDSEYSSKYTRTRKEQDVAEKKVTKSEKKENESKEFGYLCSSRIENKEMRVAASDSKDCSRHDKDSSPEREKLRLNEDSERKILELSSFSRYDLPSTSENSTSFSFPGHDSSFNEVPSSPKQPRRASLSSPKQLVASSSHSLNDTRSGNGQPATSR